MADYPQHSVVVRVPLLGREIATLESYRIESGYMTSTDGFEFVAYDERRENLRGLEMRDVEILVDGHSQIIGRIEVTERGQSGTSVRFAGRDYIADLVECHVDPALKLKDGMTVFDAITLAAAPVGIDTVISDSDLLLRNIRTGKSARGGASKSFHEAKLDEYKANPGEGIYEFCNRIVARHGATIQPANDRGSVAVTAPLYDQEPLYSIRRSIHDIPGVDAVVLEGAATRNFTSFPTYMLATGKQGRAGKTRSGTSFEFSTHKLARVIGGELEQTLDSTIHLDRIRPGEVPPALAQQILYRLHYMRDEDSRNREQLERAATRAFAERFKDTLSYSVTLRGHADPITGALWSTDTIVEVHDEVCEVYEPLWIESRTFEFSEKQGATTHLECWRPGSFQL